ncbi:hypothetical protein MRX96_054529 [Rhipicephalus microplus]
MDNFKEGSAKVPSTGLGGELPSTCMHCVQALPARTCVYTCCRGTTSAAFVRTQAGYLANVKQAGRAARPLAERAAAQKSRGAAGTRATSRRRRARSRRQ